jgi:hypothetical protein
MWPIVLVVILFIIFLVVLAALALSDARSRINQQDCRINTLAKKVCDLEAELQCKKKPVTLFGEWSINATVDDPDDPLNGTGAMLLPAITPQGFNTEIATVRGDAQSSQSSVIPAVRKGQVRYITSEAISLLTSGSVTVTLYINGIPQVAMFSSHSSSDSSIASVSSGAPIHFNALDLLSLQYTYDNAVFTDVIPPAVVTAQLWVTFS